MLGNRINNSDDTDLQQLIELSLNQTQPENHTPVFNQHSSSTDNLTKLISNHISTSLKENKTESKSKTPKPQAHYQLLGINSQKPFHTYENIYIDHQPDTCPLCQSKITPKFVYSQINPADENGEVVYQCPYSACGKLFLTYFQNQKTKGQLSKYLFHFQFSKPYTYSNKQFSSEINSISTEFVLVYNQSLEAETMGLDRIAGVGYRKALEFLIKDYCIYKTPKEAEAIKKDLLMKVIKERISDEEIELIAERATWLGNDETHYVRTWQNRDIHDLKEMIDITQEFITKKIKFKKLLESMPEKKHK